MSKKERIEYVQAGLQAYERLNDRSKQITTKADWIALKLNCSKAQAAKYVAEAEAATTPDVKP
jgi:hypothetical protein